MQEERFEVFFQNISGLYRAVQRLRAQFAQMSGVSSVHLFWLYLLREYPEGLAASRLAELSNIDRSLVSRQLKPLLARGLVQTGEQTGKRRYGWKIRLTQEGIALAEEIAAQALAIQNHAGRGVSASARALKTTRASLPGAPPAPRRPRSSTTSRTIFCCLSTKAT